MSDGIDIPITIPGADIAKLALDQIVKSFTGLEGEILKVAEKSDSTKDAFGKLKDQFLAGTITAVQLRESLAAVASQSSQVTGALQASGSAVDSLKDHSNGLKAALVNVKDAGLHELSQKAGELGQRLGGVGGQIAQVAIRSAAAFGPVGVAITGVGAALAFAMQAYEAHAAKVALDNARTEELTRSTNILGESYPSLTVAVQGATTAAEAHSRALEENQRILGQQLALINASFSVEEAQRFTLQMQNVSGAVRELGTFLHGANEELVRQTIESGNAAAQEALLGFSFAHSADAMQEHTNRVNAGIIVSHRAAEAIADHKRELVEREQAALAAARAELADASSVEDNGTAHRVALDHVRAATDALAEAQRNALVAQRNATAGAREAVTALDALDASARAAEETAHDAAMRRGQAAIDRVEAARRRRTASHGPHEEGKSEKADELAADRQMIAAREAEAHGLAALREQERRETEARDALRRADLDHATERLRAQHEREKAESVEGARAVRETERLHREQQRRLAMTQTYTERMRDLHGEEFDSTRALAEGTTAAFAGMADAFGKHLQAFVTGKETIGDALQGMLSDTLASIAQQATVKGALELAEGISALAGIVTAPLAPGHFAAAGAYFGVAALAGVGAAAVAPSSPSVAAPASAPREPAARLSKGGASSEGGGTVYNVTFGGPMYGTGGVRQAARQMVGAINRGAVQGGVQLLPGVLMGGGAGS